MYLEYIDINTTFSKLSLIVINMLQEKVISCLNIEKMRTLLRYRKWNYHEKVQWSILLKYWVKKIKEKSMSGKEIITTD